MSRVLIRLAAVAALSAGLACADEPTLGSGGAVLQLSPSAPVIETGQRLQLSARVTTRTGRVVQGASVRFGSDRPDVAQVDSTGNVWALSPGIATITAVSARLRATAHIIVVRAADERLARLDLLADSVRADLWDLLTVYVTFTATDRAGRSVCGRDALTFRSNNPAVATAEYDPLAGNPCLITFRPRGAGRTRLEVTAEGLSDSVEVVVTGARYRGSLARGDPSQPMTVGTTVRYLFTAIDHKRQPVVGMRVNFWLNDGTLSIATTDSAGIAGVDWRLPTRRDRRWGDSGHNWMFPRASIAVDATWPDGSVFRAGETVTLAADRPAGIVFLVQRQAMPMFGACIWDHAEHRGVVEMANGMCGRGLRIGVIDRYGNPVRDPVLLPRVVSNDPAALEGETVASIVDELGLAPDRFWVMHYPMDFQPPGLTLTASLPDDPAVPSRTVTVCTFCP